MADAWSLLATTGLAEWMRVSRWGYAAVSALHVFGIALLVGAVLPLDLRLLGLWPSVPLVPLVRVLRQVAATGLAVAVVFGGLLFLAAPATYASTAVFQAKMLLVLLGTLSALWFGVRRDTVTAPRALRRTVAVMSLLCWLPALALGRLVAFVAE